MLTCREDDGAMLPDHVLCLGACHGAQVGSGFCRGGYQYACQTERCCCEFTSLHICLLLTPAKPGKERTVSSRYQVSIRSDARGGDKQSLLQMRQIMCDRDHTQSYCEGFADVPISGSGLPFDWSRRKKEWLPECRPTRNRQSACLPAERQIFSKSATDARNR